MIPLIALLIGGGALVTQIALEYRQAHTARVYADAVLPALQTDAALDSEFFAVTQTNPADLKKARAITDENVVALQSALKDLKGVDSRTSTLDIQADALSSTLTRINDARNIVDRLNENGGLPGLQSDAGVRQITGGTATSTTPSTA